MRPKIVLIGAGSVSFGPNTLVSLLGNANLGGCTIALVDLDQEKLAQIERLANRLNEAWDKGIRVIACESRRQVMDGADFIVASIEVPPREKLWQLDWEIPIKHGLRQPYGENGGPGGLMHAFRQIPPFMDIVRDMEELCPQAWLINYSNPLPRIMRAVTRHSRVKVIGKCHQINVGYAIAAVLLADYLGITLPEAKALDLHSNPENGHYIQHLAALGRSRIQITAAGLNHFTWMLEVCDRDSGQDLYPLMRHSARHPPGQFEPLSMELFRIFGYCPVPGDSHLAEYLPWTHDSVAKPWEYFDLQLYDWEGSARHRSKSQELLSRIVAGTASIERLSEVPSEGAAELIEALSRGNRYHDEAVNVPNKGAIANLPEESIVELPVDIIDGAIHRKEIGPLPEPIAELCRREAALVELVVRAAVTGDRQAALQALLLDPMINDIHRAKSILNEYLSEFSEYLPQF